MTVSLAKRLIEPTWCTVCGVPWNGTGEPVWVETAGPEVGELAASAGLAPDPEQQMILDIIFAIGANGKSAAFEVDVLGPRQNFKTGVVIMAELGWLYVVPQRLVIHTSHKTYSSFEAFRETRKLIEGTPHLAKHLDPRVGRGAESRGITEAATRWGVHLVNDRRLLYLARSPGAGRSLAGDKVVLDEFYAAEPPMLGDLAPVLSTRPDPQIITASSAGKPESVALRKVRDAGRVGANSTQAFVEYGDREAGKGCELDNCSHEYEVVKGRGCAFDDEARWARFMTALGRRISLDTVRALRQTMSASEFGRELMMWHEDPADGDAELALDMDRWQKIRNKRAPKPGEAVLFLAVARDRSESSIGVGASGSDGRTLVLTYTEPGTGWVAKKVRDLVNKRTIIEIGLDPATQASVLMTGLDKYGIEYEALPTREVKQACGWFIEAVNEGTHRLEHAGQKELTQEVALATTKQSGELEAWIGIDGRPLPSLTAGATAARRWALLGDYDVMDSVL